MTRFARAKGSKSSNVKAPEDSTPWEVMKEQLLKSKQESEESQKRKEAEDQRIENYNNFLKEHKIQKRKATWCQFPETESSKKPKADTTAETHNKDKSKNKKNRVNHEQNDEETSKNKISEEKLNNNSDIAEESPRHEGKFKNKKNNKKKFAASDPEHKTNESEEVSHKNVTNRTQNQPKKSKNKFDGQPVRRKVVNDNSFQLIINGKEVELVRFDGFPIMKKDAERLQELKNNMIKKGIPKSEVQRNMKLERRRAEKALARIKREVCYNCRKGGHNLSDCPDLKSNIIPGKEVAEGICFKCGSTEHRQFECKVQRDMEFRFATCFICKESGHIARQCPDNPKGLYPNGGCCKLCGDVTHLKKDCHSIKDKKEETTIKLPTLNNDIEDIGFIPKSATKQTPAEVQKKPKKIKF